MPLHLFFSSQLKPIIGRFLCKSLRVLLLPLTAILICVSPPLMGEELGKDLTLQQAIEKSLLSHPALAGYQYQLMRVDALAKQAAVGEKPEINLFVEDALGTGQYTAIDRAQSTLSISWILQDRLLEQRVNAAQSKTHAVEIEREIQRYDIAAQTAHAFLAVLGYQEKIGVAGKARQYAIEILNEIQRRVDAGRSPLADKLQAEVNLERRELAIEDLRHELTSAKKLLAAQWGNSEFNFAKASGDIELGQQLVNYDELLENISNNPDIRYFLTQQRVVDSEIVLAQEEVKNRWRFNTGVRRYESTNDYGLTFGVTLPLGKPARNQHEIAALNALQARYRAEARAKKIQLTTQLYVLYQELQHTYHLTDALTHNILPRLESALIETQAAYSLGKYSYREWYALQNEVLETRMQLINVSLKAYNNQTEIERLTGLNISQSTSTSASPDRKALRLTPSKTTGTTND